MVLGIGEGSIDILMEKTNFAPGEMISGTVRLNLKEPKNAKELRAVFYGERSERYGKSRRTVRVYEFKQILGGEKQYFNDEMYKFQIKIPEEIVTDKPHIGGPMGSMMDIALFFVGPSPIKWYISSSLSMPMSFDISKKIQISISEVK